MAPSVRQLTSRLLAHALSLPGAWEDHPWGENVAKVGKKVFVFFGVPDPRDEQMIVCVKLPESGVSALDLDCCEPAGYGLGKSGWVMARFGVRDAPDVARLEAWIVESYRAVAPKTLVAQLDGAQPAAPRVTLTRTSARKAEAKRPAAKKKVAAKPAPAQRAPKRRAAKPARKPRSGR